MTKVAINGFGRIGRNVFRAGFNRPGIEFVADKTKKIRFEPKHKIGIRVSAACLAEGLIARSGAAEAGKAGDAEPFSALAFKIATDPYVGRLCYFRVYSGGLDAGSYVHNTRTGKNERISRLFQMHANKQNSVLSTI